MDNRPIGIFDSGVGGLSILRELHKLLPGEDYIFLADQINVPYGEKNKSQLISLTYKIVDFFISKNAKLIVVACNTATCYTIDALRKKYDLPIVGTVPAIKPAIEMTRTNVVAVISTPATSKSSVLNDLINKYGKDVEVINIGCKGLEDTVENGKLNSPQTKNLVKKYLVDIKNSRADHLVLGYTHYPFLKYYIQQTLGHSIKLVDSGLAVANRTKSLLLINKISNTTQKLGKTIYFTTGNPKKFSETASVLLKQSVIAAKIRLYK